MKSIKKILFKILSQQAYLKTLHRSFYLLYNLGLLKKNASFKYHYAVKELIEPNYTIIDIGANLGYFSKNFSKLAHNGQVISVEPVPQFYAILNYFLGKRKNVTIHNVALGDAPGKLDMVLPESDGMIRTGLPHIAKNEEEKKGQKTVEVAIVKGSELFSQLERIDYIKCDIEGYEWVVFQEIKNLVNQKRPIVQLEVSVENEENILNLFKEIGYLQYGISNFKLVQENGEQSENGDFLFVPKEKQKNVEGKKIFKG